MTFPSTPRPDDTNPLPDVAGLSLGRRADLFRTDQARRWQAGDRVPVEHYLTAHPELSQDGEHVLLLVYGEVLLRERHGEAPALEEYQARFPRLADELAAQFRCHAALGPPPLPAPQHAGPSPAARPAVPGFAVMEELGRGGHGVVYRAVQDGLNRHVALKMLADHAAADPDAAARLTAEAEAAARLRHPNVAEVFAWGTHAGRPYFALELLPGGGLDKKLAGNPLPNREAAALVAAVADGVAAAHAAGLVHRDLKPANVLLAADGTPKVTDFGLVRWLEGGAGLTRTGVIVGTPGYIAPEQMDDGRTVGPAADVYALGAVLYECLTGRPPHRAVSAIETLRLARETDPVPPRQLNPEAARELETIALRCLAREPGDRYPTAADVAADLRRFLAGEPIHAKPVGAWGQLRSWVRRPERVRDAGAVLFVAGTAFLLWCTLGIVSIFAGVIPVRSKPQAALYLVGSIAVFYAPMAAAGWRIMTRRRGLAWGLAAALVFLAWMVGSTATDWRPENGGLIQEDPRTLMATNLLIGSISALLVAALAVVAVADRSRRGNS